MQYQVFKKDTGELIAWIDTNGLDAGYERRLLYQIW